MQSTLPKSTKPFKHQDCLTTDTRPDGTIDCGTNFNEKHAVTVHKIKDGVKFKAIIFPSKSRTKTEFYKDCSMHNIMRQYLKTGQLGDPTQKTGVFGDFSSATDFADMMNKVVEAQQGFKELPAETRTRFANDPAQLIQFLNEVENNPDLYTEGVTLGLLKPKPADKGPKATEPPKAVEKPPAEQKKEPEVPPST